jgi:hypothetical protein
MTNTPNPAIETTSIRESMPTGIDADRRIRVHQSVTGTHAYVWMYWRSEDTGLLEAKHLRLTESELAALAAQIETVRAAIRDYLR